MYSQSVFAIIYTVKIIMQKKKLLKKNRIGSKKSNFFSFQYFWLELYLVISDMYFHLKKNSFVIQLSKKVFILLFDEGCFQGKKIIYF